MTKGKILQIKRAEVSFLCTTIWFTFRDGEHSLDLALALSHESLLAKVVWTAYRVLPGRLPLMSWVDLEHAEEIICV